MKGDPIIFKEVDEGEKNLINNVLVRYYSKNLKLNGGITKFDGPFVASRIYRFDAFDANERLSKYVFKKLLWRKTDTLAELKESLESLEFIYSLIPKYFEHGLSVPKTIMTDDGRFIANEDTNLFTVQEMLEGEHMSGTLQEIESTAKNLAKLHLISKELEREDAELIDLVKKYSSDILPFNECAEKYKAMLRKELLTNEFHRSSSNLNCGRTEICDYIRDNIPNLDEMINFALENRKKINFDSLPGGIIHNDFHPNNALYKNGQITGILDWDLVGVGPFNQDLAKTFLRSVSNYEINNPGGDYKKAAAIFLENYNNVRPMTKEEKSVLVPMLVEMDLRIILRGMYRHCCENDRLGDFMNKLKDRVIPSLLVVFKKYNYLY